MKRQTFQRTDEQAYDRVEWSNALARLDIMERQSAVNLGACRVSLPAKRLWTPYGLAEQPDPRRRKAVH